MSFVDRGSFTSSLFRIWALTSEEVAFYFGNSVYKSRCLKLVLHLFSTNSAELMENRVARDVKRFRNLLNVV